MTIPQKIYLDMVCARNFPEQEPEYVSATWWHVLWFLVPMMGIIIFSESVKQTYYKQQKQKTKCV